MDDRGNYNRGMEDLFIETIRTGKVPVDHYVDNTMPATPCAKCGLSHGGAERNKKRS